MMELLQNAVEIFSIYIFDDGWEIRDAILGKLGVQSSNPEAAPSIAEVFSLHNCLDSDTD